MKYTQMMPANDWCDIYLLDEPSEYGFPVPDHPLVMWVIVKSGHGYSAYFFSAAFVSTGPVGQICS